MSQNNIYVQLKPEGEVLNRLKELIEKREPWVWVRRELKAKAETILKGLQINGKLIAFDYDGERASRGSVCYKIEY